MRIVDTEKSPAGKKRVLFATSYEELDILFDILESAMSNFPKNGHPETFARMKNMAKEFKIHTGKAVAKKSRDSETPCTMCKRKLRGERALKSHLQDVHKQEVKHENT